MENAVEGIAELDAPTREVFDKLIDLGRSGGGYVPFESGEYRLLQHHPIPDNALDHAAKSLSEEYLRFLIKGVTLAEIIEDKYKQVLLDKNKNNYEASYFTIKYLYFQRDGSTTRVPIVFFPYGERFGPDKADRLARWIQRKSPNPWMPFGGLVSPGTTYASLMDYRENYEYYACEKLVQEKLGKIRRLKQKRKTSAQRAVDRKEESKKRSLGHARFIKRLSELSIEDRMSEIVSSDFPLEAISDYLIPSTPSEVRGLDDGLKKALLLRVDRRRRGKWGQLARLLRA